MRLQLADTTVQVVELVPPAVQTDLLPGWAESEFAMPLDDFADEVVALIGSQPDAHEILVERVGFLRFAAERGNDAETVALTGSRIRKDSPTRRPPPTRRGVSPGSS